MTSASRRRPGQGRPGCASGSVLSAPRDRPRDGVMTGRAPPGLQTGSRGTARPGNAGSACRHHQRPLGGSWRPYNRLQGEKWAILEYTYTMPYIHTHTYYILLTYVI